MNDDKLPPSAETAQGEVSEEKRRAARRRFLLRGAAGSGVAVVTLYHQRSSLAQTPVIYTSSPEFCVSLKGTPNASQTDTIPNPSNPTQTITAFQCNNVDPAKVPWAP